MILTHDLAGDIASGLTLSPFHVSCVLCFSKIFDGPRSLFALNIFIHINTSKTVLPLFIDVISMKLLFDSEIEMFQRRGINI